MYHVLLRHLAPRHPPYALSSLRLPGMENLTLSVRRFFLALRFYFAYYSTGNVLLAVRFNCQLLATNFLPVLYLNLSIDEGK